MAEPEKYEHECSVENAAQFLDWIKNRGGVAIWKSINFSDLGKTWSTPALEKDGTPKKKQSWEMDNEPYKIVTDPEKIRVYFAKEHKRFHVATRMGSQGMSIKVTDGGSRKIWKEVEKAGEGAFYVFDYFDEQNCVIMVPDKSKEMSLAEWERQHAANDPAGSTGPAVPDPVPQADPIQSPAP